nr:ribonuclease H-like domain-containing protein [Tanacetum cinerariifolium]
RYKARLVANGSTQVEGVDVDENFSPVIKPGTIRTVLSLAISRHWPIHQLDVKNAFLHGDLAETVYMHQPPGFRDPENLNYGDDTAFLLLYVDDNILTASSDRSLQQIIASLHREFSMTDLGVLNYFFGISVTRDSSGMFLSQRKYAIEILERAQMVGCNPSRTPVDAESKLRDGGTPVVDPTLYRSLAGSFHYLTFTRPDITYAVQEVCLYMYDTREPHFSALKQILRYVQGTLDYGLQLFSSTTDSLIAYSDTDWAGCLTTRRSTSGYCVFLGNNLLSWSSKRQPTLSRSSAKAEYRGVANAVAETCWIRNLLRELHTHLSSALLCIVIMGEFIKEHVGISLGNGEYYNPSIGFGFGYDESVDDYKVVEIISGNPIRGFETRVNIYSLKSGYWKRLICDLTCGFLGQPEGMFFNGALHWIIGHADSPSSNFLFTIILFDLATETFGKILQPVYDKEHDCLSLCTFGEWFSVVCYLLRENRSDVWVMKVYGVQDSWTKLVSITHQIIPELPLHLITLCITQDGQILLRFKKELVLYDPKNSSFTERFR